MGKIEMLCELLPADTNWGDMLTPQIVEEIVWAEREACAKICRERADKIAAEAERCRSEEPDEVSALCSTAWQLTVAENEILKRSNAELTGRASAACEGPR